MTTSKADPETIGLMDVRAAMNWIAAAAPIASFSPAGITKIVDFRAGTDKVEISKSSVF